MQQAALFGGAITANFPQRFVDVSPFREVPDNQEVWVDADTDQSIIIELLHYDSDVADADCLAFHWNELAVSNDASGPNAVLNATQVLTAETIPGVVYALYQGNRPLLKLHLSGTSYRGVLRGQQSVSKFREAARNIVTVDLAILRLPQQETDILISLNTPAAISEASSSAAVVTNTTAADENSNLFQTLVASFTIRDYNLFNG